VLFRVNPFKNGENTKTAILDNVSLGRMSEVASIKFREELMSMNCHETVLRRSRRSSTSLDGMAFARLTLFSVVFVLSACAATPREVDGMCPAIAAFANASDASLRSVRLTTDWGGVYTRSDDPTHFVMAAKGCAHDGFEPGKALCAYLLEETSTEFPAVNYRRALRCLGRRVSGLSPTDDNKLPPSAMSRHVSDVRRGVTVKIELLNGTETTPRILEISAQKDRS